MCQRLESALVPAGEQCIAKLRLKFQPHENPIRRQYYDSGANEGIGFYAEELMVQFGLFDDSPKTREVMDDIAA